MEAFRIYLLFLALILETSAVILLLRRTMRLQRRLAELHLVCNERLGALEHAVLELEGESDTAPETRADDRKKAREAERRFTEGVANILSFSCAAVGRKGEI
jgi:hypothetical protein